ncbi:MAG TPA: hypothetical protein VL995_21220 [Cellvibrio sp.]|nr:hypothetical protein [Cellvibrio sp.]
MKSLVMAYFLIFLFSVESVAGDDLYVDGLCGISLNKDNPCDWIRAVDFRVGSYSEKHGKMLALSENYVESWIASKKSSYRRDVSFTLDKLPFIHNMTYGYDDNLKVYILLNSFADDGILINFILSSKKSFEVINRYCSSRGSDVCIKDNINEFLTENILKRFID